MIKLIYASFHRKLESIQYNAALAVTGTMRGTSKENTLSGLIPKQNTRYAKINSKDIPQYRTYNEYFKNSFFPATIKEWNMLDSDIRGSENLKTLSSITTSSLKE